ncbi:MAG: ATP-binding protein [bacterium]|nr:ATP-binding protein [bacterium]
MKTKKNRKSIKTEREVFWRKRRSSKVVTAWLLLAAIAVLVWFGDALIDKIFFYSESYEEIAVTDVSAFEIYFRSSLILLLFIIGIIVTYRTVEKAKSEELIEFEREQTLKIFDSIDEQIYIIDPASHEILYKNKKVEELFGDSEGKRCEEYFTNHGGDCSKCSMNYLTESGSEGFRSDEYYNSKADRWYHAIEKVIKWIDGRDAVYTILIDITERKRTEAEAFKASKVETLEVISGSIVHDFNNVLTTIIMSLSLAKHLAQKEEKLAGLIGMAENAAFKAKDITHQLLSFGRGEEMALKHAHMEKLIRESADFILKNSNLKYSVISEKDLPLVMVDVTQVAQVMNNLLINAKQAVGEDGEIQIKLSSGFVSRKDQMPLKEGKYLIIAVTDNGVGIPSAHIHRIFDPYFTTKKEGTGLGLASCYMIMSRHGGYIKVESLVGRGSTFTVFIPASDERRQQRESEKPTESTRPIKGIFVDDDEMLANVTSLMINYQENHIEAVSSISKAEKILSQKREQADIVILDNTLPGSADPVETMRKLKTISPSSRFVLLLSFDDKVKKENFLNEGFDLVLSKPVKPEKLIREIRAILK